VVLLVFSVGENCDYEPKTDFWEVLLIAVYVVFSTGMFAFGLYAGMALYKALDFGLLRTKRS
jgi:hypothetical protein